MMGPIFNIMVDGILAVLLIAAIVVCWLVYKRLAIIKDGQNELRVLVDNLNHSIINARASVTDLKDTSFDVEARLQGEVRRAQTMSDELAIIIEAGNNLADRVDAGLTSAAMKKRAANKEKLASDDVYARDEGAFPEPVSQDSNARKEQKELLAALREAR